MKKAIIVLVVLVVLGGVFYAFLYVNDLRFSELKFSDFSVRNVENIKNFQNLSGAGLAAKRFLEMWDRGEYEKLYRNFSSDVQQLLPLSDFLETRSTLLVGGVLRPQIEDVKEEGTTATVQASIVNIDIKTITAEIFDKKGSAASAQGLERKKVLIELKNERGGWRISQMDPITDALRRMEEQRKKKRLDVEASREAELYVPKLSVTALRAQVIHLYGQRPFIVGLLKNAGDRQVQRLGIRFTVKDAAGAILAEDTYHPVVE